MWKLNIPCSPIGLGLAALRKLFSSVERRDLFPSAYWLENVRLTGVVRLQVLRTMSTACNAALKRFRDDQREEGSRYRGGARSRTLVQDFGGLDTTERVAYMLQGSGYALESHSPKAALALQQRSLPDYFRLAANAPSPHSPTLSTQRGSTDLALGQLVPTSPVPSPLTDDEAAATTPASTHTFGAESAKWAADRTVARYSRMSVLP